MSDDLTAVSLFIDAAPREHSVLEDVLNGLSRRPPTLPPRLFYDAEGSHLFDAICELEEYYPTRTEVGILRTCISEMASAVGPDAALIEYGSGSSQKTEILLEALERPYAYLPIDISREHLLASAERIARRHPDLRVLPVCADYTQEIPGMASFARDHHAVVFFPGSTIGNFEPAEAEAFLRRIRTMVGSGGGLLIGVDLQKDRAVLEAAYDDAQGVTAAFNLNMLRHINRVLGDVFDVSAFAHRALWNDEAGRIEMHLVARRSTAVTVGGRTFRFEKGDAIVTEHSYKYTLDSFTALAERAGFDTEKVWTDERGWFSVRYLVAS